MSQYYTGRQARTYNTRLRMFTHRTLSESLAMVDEATLRSVKTREGRPPRVLDVACGTGRAAYRVFKGISHRLALAGLGIACAYKRPLLYI